MTLSWCGANLGGVTITQAPSTAGVDSSERSVMVAVTGPSDMSSYQPSLPPEAADRVAAGEADVAVPAEHQQEVVVVAADLPERHGVTGLAGEA